MICTRCVLDESVPGVNLDANGVCAYCHFHDEMEAKYPIGDEHLHALADEMRVAGKGRDFDCIIGVSGGCDSSFLLHLTKTVLGLRPMAVSFDNGWDTPIAKKNQKVMTDALGIPLKVYAVDPQEYNDIIRSFLYASVTDADIANDMGITTVLYRAMDEFGVDYVLDGHCFRTEGIAPIGWTYMDGQYVKSVHKRFGTKRIITFPNLELEYWLPRIGKKRPRLLYHVDYRKEAVKSFLEKTYGWEWYGAHHAENLYTKFIGDFLLPQKFDIDKRKIELAALVRSGQMSRDVAIEQLRTRPPVDWRLLTEVMRRLLLSPSMLMSIMDAPHKTHRDYQTYHQYFVDHRAEFEQMAAEGKLPMTFVRKYTQP